MPQHRSQRTAALALLVSTAEAASTRFTQWFPYSAEEFADTSAVTCNKTLQLFENAYDSQSNKAWIDLGLYTGRPIYQLCKNHMSCILNHTSEANKASLSTAGVVLGLLPTLLAVLSPSISELALLSAQRPLLASLLSLGAPGVLQTRIFEYEDPSELLDPPEGSRQNVRAQLILGPWTSKSSLVLAAVEYVFTLACCVNTVSLAIQLSNRSVLSWGCTRTWPTIVWAFVPLVIHGIAALGYRLTLESRRGRQHSRNAPDGSTTGHPFRELTSSGQDSKMSGTTTTALQLQNLNEPRKPATTPAPWLRREGTSCTSHSQNVQMRLPRLNISNKVNIGIFLTCIAGFLSFFHLLYGTVTFSGLLFIQTLDAIGIVSMRFLASSIICRFVVLIEIAGMRGAMQRSV